MSKSFPNIIKQFIDNNNVSKKDLYYLSVNKNGFVKNPGNCQPLAIKPIIQGNDATEIFPVLFGLFPIQNNQTISNIEMPGNLFFNLYIINDTKNVWIIFQDSSEHVKKIRKRYNNFKFHDSVHAQLLKTLNYAVFIKKPNSLFDLIPPSPDWIKQITKYQENIKLVDLFPAIENLRINPSSEKQVCTWQQTTSNNFNYNLVAHEKKIHSNTYIIIWPIDNESSGNRQELIQKARENTLAYEKLIRTEKKLNEMLEMKEQFINIISHDYRSPITTLVEGSAFLIENMNENRQVDHEDLKILSQINLELKRLLDYNDKLYRWAQMNLKKIEVHKEAIHARVFLNELYDNHKTKLNKKKINLKVKIKDNFLMHTDYVLFAQTLNNIIDNAIKFTPEGGTIEAIATQDKISIKDTGTGIPHEKIEQLKKGHVIKSTPGTNKEKGSGLGISIIQKILLELNYKLTIESEINKGSCFTISKVNHQENEQ